MPPLDPTSEATAEEVARDFKIPENPNDIDADVEQDGERDKQDDEE